MTKEEALSKSIQKWESISTGIGIDTAHNNCALCKLYNTKLGCSECPVFEDSHKDYCDNTPYFEWHMHQIVHYRKRPFRAPFMVLCPECRKLAIEELNYLKGLRKEAK